MSLNINPNQSSLQSVNGLGAGAESAKIVDMNKQAMNHRGEMMEVSMKSGKDEDRMNKIKNIINTMGDISKEMNMKL